MPSMLDGMMAAAAMKTKPEKKTNRKKSKGPGDPSKRARLRKINLKKSRRRMAKASRKLNRGTKGRSRLR